MLNHTIFLIKIFCITDTKGKTTTAYYIKSILDEYAKVNTSIYFESLCLKDYSYTNTKLFRCERFDNFNINKLILTQNYVYTYNVQKIIKEMKKDFSIKIL